MTRRFALVLLITLLGATFVATDFGAGLTGAPVAEAQQKKKRPGVFERLFGPREPPPKTSSRRSSSPIKRILPTRKKSSPTRTSPRKSTSIPVVEVGAKDPNAKKILIVGDYVGDAIAWGLDQALANEPKLAVIERTNASSGLIRTDHYDWNQELLGILNEENPDIVVVTLGTNDRQELREGEERFPVRSEKWQEVFVARVDAMADTLKVYGRPFFWVSSPPLRGENATSDIAYMNGLIEPRVVKAGGYFVDVWNGFTNASGQYITTGPDIEGQVKALRTSDGVNFTSVGKQKLAYYVERDIRRHTGVGAGAVDLLASGSQTSTIEIGPDGKKRLVGPVISLSDPPPNVAVALAGAPDPVTFDPISGKVIVEPKTPPPDVVPESETVRYRLVVKGQALPSVAGRVDDFTWPPSQRADQAFLAPPVPAETSTDGEAPLPEEDEPSVAN
ncbi:MAG TPA: DUF459 domain-containing protein [Bauldia sp.]|nr:DUF459 domain-containing protein [Bauldia sp.]